MTVSATTPKITYVYTGLGDYSFTFKIYKPRDITVYHLDTLGHANLLVLNIDYEVIQTEGVQGGVCRIINALPAGGYIAIERKLLVTQETDWVNNDPFNAEQLEDDLDRMVMILQEFNRDLTAAAVYVAWKGEWVTGTDYKERDMVSGSDLNIYTCMIAHTSSYSFSNDVANGNWALMIPVGDMEYTLEEAIAARDAAIAAASDAAASAQEAYDSAIAAAAAANDAEASSIVAINAELNAANCSVEAHDSALESASFTTECHNWANMPEDVPVPESIAPPEYSAYHWSKKAEGVVGGGITALTGIPPVLVTGDATSKVIDLDKTDRVFVPSGGTHDQALMVHAGVPIWKTPPYPTPPAAIIYGVRNLIDNSEFRITERNNLPVEGESSGYPVLDRWFISDDNDLGGDVPTSIDTEAFVGENCLVLSGHNMVSDFAIWQRMSYPILYKDKKLAISVHLYSQSAQNVTINVAVVPTSGVQFDVYDSGPIAVPAGYGDVAVVTPDLDYSGNTFNDYANENLRLKITFSDRSPIHRIFRVQMTLSDTVLPFMPKPMAEEVLNCAAFYTKNTNLIIPVVAGGRDVRRVYMHFSPRMRVAPSMTETYANRCVGTLNSTNESVFVNYTADTPESIAIIRYNATAEFLKGD